MPESATHLAQEPAQSAVSMNGEGLILATCQQAATQYQSEVDVGEASFSDGAGLWLGADGPRATRNTTRRPVALVVAIIPENQSMRAIPPNQHAIVATQHRAGQRSVRRCDGRSNSRI